MPRLDHVAIKALDQEGDARLPDRRARRHEGERPPFDFHGYWLYFDDVAVIHLMGERGRASAGRAGSTMSPSALRLRGQGRGTGGQGPHVSRTSVMPGDPGSRARLFVWQGPARRGDGSSCSVSSRHGIRDRPCPCQLRGWTYVSPVRGEVMTVVNMHAAKTNVVEDRVVSLSCAAHEHRNALAARTAERA